MEAVGGRLNGEEGRKGGRERGTRMADGERDRESGKASSDGVVEERERGCRKSL